MVVVTDITDVLEVVQLDLTMSSKTSVLLMVRVNLTPSLTSSICVQANTQQLYSSPISGDE